MCVYVLSRYLIVYTYVCIYIYKHIHGLSSLHVGLAWKPNLERQRERERDTNRQHAVSGLAVNRAQGRS